jgi:ABC-type transport system involved in multi-copper enzyme maturation permease subunit
MNAIIKYILLNGVRDRLYLGVLLTLITSFIISIIFGSTFLIEKQATVSAFSSGSSRIIFIFGIILFVCLNLRKSFESKEIEFIISKSISRQKIIISYIAGYIISSIIILIPLIIALFILTNSNPLGLIFWSSSIIMETLLIATFAILATLILNSAFSAILATMGFYILSRMMGIFVLTINLPKNYTEFSNNIMQSILKILSIAFPRLDLYSKSEWLIYGVNELLDIKIIIIQSLIYIPLLIFMSFYDFGKKQF